MQTNKTKSSSDTSKIQVCILTSVHSPFDIRIFHKEAISLSKAGYDITIIAQHGNDETKRGIKIISIPKTKNRFKRMLNTVFQIYKKALAINADIYHFHDPELIPIGLLLKHRGKLVIYDVHEDVPKDIQQKSWIPVYMRGLISKLVSVIETTSAKVLTGIISATPSIASHFPTDKTTVVQNFPLLSEIDEVKSIPYDQRLNSIVYTGNITDKYGLKEIIEAIELLKGSLDVKLIVAGIFQSQSLEEKFRKMPGWVNVDFLGWIDRSAVRNIINNARIGLVLYHPAPNHIESQPNKLFEYMQSGIPIIVSNFPHWRKIVGECGCGLMADPLDPKSIAEAIKWLIEHPMEAEIMGKRGHQAVLDSYNWDTEEKKLISFYNRLFL